MNDSEIAASRRISSPEAPAGLFDAYADRLFLYCWSRLRNRGIAQIALRDTFVAAQAHIARLAGSSDPVTLGPWLYSLARAECGRHRAVPAAEADEAPAGPGRGDAESRLTAWDTVMSMDAGEFEALDLACRHDVDPGLVLRLPAQDARALEDRSRHSLERALGAQILLGRRHACPDRAEVLGGWAGPMTAELRERVLGHAAGCETCGPNLPRNVSAARVFALLPAPALSPLARAEVLAGLTPADAPAVAPDAPAVAPAPAPRGRRPRRASRARLLIAGVGAAAAVVIASALALAGSAARPAAVRHIVATMAAGTPTGPARQASGPGSEGAVPSSIPSGRPAGPQPRLSASPPMLTTGGKGQFMVVGATRPPSAKAAATQKSAPQQPAGAGTPPASPGTLQLSTNDVAVGTGSAGQITLTAVGGEVDWSATSSAPSRVSLDSYTGTLQAGQSVTLTVLITRGGGGGRATISFEPPASAPQAVLVSWRPLPGGHPSPPAPTPAPTSASPSDTASASPSS